MNSVGGLKTEKVTMKTNCTYKGRNYVHGEKRCYLRKCFVCESGHWIETIAVKNKCVSL